MRRWIMRPIAKDEERLTRILRAVDLLAWAGVHDERAGDASRAGVRQTRVPVVPVSARLVVDNEPIRHVMKG